MKTSETVRRNPFNKRPVLFGILVVLVSMSMQLYAVPPERKLRIMTYNILNGFDHGKDSLRKQKTAELIASHHPDVVALQELCGFTEATLATFAKGWGHSYAVILKEGGYPVGLTSSMPIVLKKKWTEDLWHGMLHASTHGIDFLVVHLSPSDVQVRRKEARLITDYMTETLADAENYIVLGDFNAHSPSDADLDKAKPMLLEKYRKSDAKYEGKNLADGQFDYSVISRFLGYPLVDVCERMIEPENRFSFPTPILVGTYRKEGEIVPTRERIDYILTSAELAGSCTDAKIINAGIVEKLSDHFPLIADFELH